MATYTTLKSIEMVLSVSEGNSKLGQDKTKPMIANISTRPVWDCGPNARYCAKQCYACKAFGRNGQPGSFPSCTAAWTKNSLSFRTNRSEAFAALDAWLAKKTPRFFRWHVSGDWLDQDMVDQAFDLAARHPAVRFLAFTKRDDLDYSARPANLTIVASMWPGMPDRFPVDLPRAWMQDGTEDRVPADAIECPGLCQDCGM